MEQDERRGGGIARRGYLEFDVLDGDAMNLGHAPERTRSGLRPKPGIVPHMTDFGEGLRPGDAHYRAYVGPPGDYDVIAATQVSLLFAAGLRETHLLCDVGCGSLRAGRLLIPYLRPGHYFGIEPNRWLVEEGIERELGRDMIDLKRPTFSWADDFSLAAFGVEFDFVVAQSIFSHTFPDLTAVGFAGVRAALAPDGVLVATFVEGDGGPDGAGWEYPGCVEYTWPTVKAMLAEAGLAGHRVDWMHPRQRWFVASRDDNPGRAGALSSSLRRPTRRS